MTNIILIGLPGAGKTAIGSELALLINWEFIDSDRLIEKRCGSSCREFYKERGERLFRSLEEEVIKELAGVSRSVIALGGGALEIPAVRALLKGFGLAVYIAEEIEILIERKVAGDTPATLKEGESSYRELARRRLPHLQNSAELIIESNGRDPKEIAKEIAERARGSDQQ